VRGKRKIPLISPKKNPTFESSTNTTDPHLRLHSHQHGRSSSQGNAWVIVVGAGRRPGVCSHAAERVLAEGVAGSDDNGLSRRPTESRPERLSPCFSSSTRRVQSRELLCTHASRRWRRRGGHDADWWRRSASIKTRRSGHMNARLALLCRVASVSSQRAHTGRGRSSALV
jgi:hypothetical protein